MNRKTIKMEWGEEKLPSGLILPNMVYECEVCSYKIDRDTPHVAIGHNRYHFHCHDIVEEVSEKLGEMP